MKKLVIMMTIAAAAILSNAATVTWSSSGNLAPNPDGSFSASPLSGGLGLLFYGAQNTAALIEAIEGETFTGAGAIATKNTSTTGAISMLGVGSYANQSVTLYMVLFDGPTIATSSFYMISDDYTQTFTTVNKTYSFTTANGRLPTEWSPVPEPTSMALLGLGVALVGLRRKFRK